MRRIILWRVDRGETSDCAGFNALLVQRGARPLPPEDERRLAEHLVACEDCRDLERTFTAPPASPCLENRQLFAGGPDVEDHLTACARCRRIREVGYTRTLNGSSCAEVQPLLQRAAGITLSDADEHALLEHLERCNACMALAVGLGSNDLEGLDAAVAARSAHDADDFPELRVIEPENYVRAGEIARGGMGRIVRARDRRLGRSVVLKELLDGRLRPRFEDEARLTARLQHPAIVHVHEAGRWPSGGSFYAMKDVAGKPLDRVIAEKHTLAERMALLPNFITVVDAIAYAHSVRVIHRDLKPANILLGPFGETVVIDWGLAKDLALADEAPVGGPYRDESGFTIAGAGTPGYMPPEQAIGQGGSERVDVYALGATLYHVLAGAPPFGVRPVREILEALKSGGPPSLAEVEPGVPPALITIVQKAMARDPAGRYASAAELAEDLKRYQTGQLVRAHAYSAGELARRFLRRHRVPVAISALALASLAAVGATSVSRIVRERDRSERALASLYEEQGRRELADGHPHRALSYLDQAAERVPATAGLQTLLASAERSAAAVIGTLDGKVSASPMTLFGWLGDHDVITTTEQGAITRWDLPSRAPFELPFPGYGSTLASPDGSYLVVFRQRWEKNGKLHLVEPAIVWDAKSGTTRATLGGAAPPEQGVICAGGRRLVTVNEAHAIQVWDTTTGALLRSLENVRMFDGRAWLATGRCDPAGTRLLVSGIPTDRPAELWDLARGELVTRVEGVARPADGEAELSPDGRHLVTASPLGVVVRDARTGAQVAELAHEGRPQGLAFSPDGTRLLVAGELGSTLFDAATWKRIAVLGGARGLAQRAFSPVGQLAVLCDVNGRTVVADVTAGLELAVVGEDCSENETPSFSPDGTRILSSERPPIHGGPITVWSVAALGLPSRVLLATGPAASVALRPDGVQLAAISADRTRVLVQDVSGGGVMELAQPGAGRIWSAVYSPDGRRLASSGRDGSARIFDARSGSLVATLAGHTAQVNALAFSPDGRSIATASDDQTVRVWDAETGAWKVTYAGLKVGLFVVAFSPDGRRVASGGASSEAHVWDAQSGKLIAVLPGHLGAVTAIHFRPDGTRLLTVDSRGAVRLWGGDLAKETVLVRGADSPNMVDLQRFSGFSPDGRWAAAVVADRGLEVFDAEAGQPHSRLAPATRFTGAAVSPDSALMVSGCDRRDLCLWDVARSTRSIALHGQRGAPTWVAFSPDGARVLALDHTGELIAWPVPRARRP